MGNSYLDVLKKKGTTDVELHLSPRRQALVDQKGRCAKCKKDINPAFSKFIKDPISGKYKVICSNCAVEIPKR